MSLLEYVEASCPYCGEWLQISVEPSAATQAYGEDCQVCCQPLLVQVDYVLGAPQVILRREDGAD